MAGSAYSVSRLRALSRDALRENFWETRFDLPNGQNDGRNLRTGADVALLDECRIKTAFSSPELNILGLKRGKRCCIQGAIPNGFEVLLKV